MKKITRREFGKRVALSAGGAAVLSSALPQAFAAQKKEGGKKPNIVFICSDQHSFNYAGFAGHPHVKTPNLDRIAERAVVFTDSYSGQPVCVPGRASLMTGMYASDEGSYCNSTVWDGSHPLWGSYLQDAGYYTRACGKMDLDDTRDTGFDEHLTGHGHLTNPDITSLFRSPACYRMNERPNVDGGTREEYHQSDYEITLDAEKFIRDEAPGKDKPFALYMGYQQPHPQFNAKPEYFNLYYPDNVDMPDVTEEELEEMHLVYQSLRHFKRIATPIDKEKIKRARAAYYGMVTELDELIGRIWTALEETGQLENTWFIYTSDHGESLGEHGLWYKNNLYDCSVRIPLMITGPGMTKRRTVSTPVAHIDLVPTLLEIADVAAPSYLRGESLTPLMRGKDRGHEEVVYAESHSEGNCTGSFMIRKGDWKYIYFSHYDDLLYNLKDDPGEKRNRVDDPEAASVLAEMKQELFKRVDPDQITADAFAKQDAMLRQFAETMTEEELQQKFLKRLGKGQAAIYAARAKGRIK